MLKANLAENFQMSVDETQGRTTISHSAYVGGSKDDDSVSMRQDIEQLSGGRNTGFGLTSFYSSDFALEHSKEISDSHDQILHSMIGAVNYYNSIQSAKEKKDGKILYNLVQAMKIARSVYRDRSDDLDHYWDMKMASKKQGTKLRTRTKVGAMGDHINYRNSKGEVTNKAVRNERGTTMTLLNSEGLKHFSEAAPKIQAVYDSEIEKISTWSNEAMLEADKAIAAGITTLGIWTPTESITSPLDVDLVSTNLKEIAKFMNVDVKSLMDAINF